MQSKHNWVSVRSNDRFQCYLHAQKNIAKQKKCQFGIGFDFARSYCTRWCHPFQSFCRPVHSKQIAFILLSVELPLPLRRRFLSFLLMKETTSYVKQFAVRITPSNFALNLFTSFVYFLSTFLIHIFFPTILFYMFISLSFLVCLLPFFLSPYENVCESVRYGKNVWIHLAHQREADRFVKDHVQIHLWRFSTFSRSAKSAYYFY